MAKKGMIERNNRRKKLAKTYRAKRDGLKAIVRDKEVSPEERFQAVLALSELPRNSSRIRIRNRCELTGRPRGFYRRFRVSRIILREYASQALIPGVVKSSW